MTQDMQRTATGNALMEYAIPAVLIVAVCVITMQTVGSNLNGIFSDLKSDMSRTSKAAKLASEQQIAAKSTGSSQSTPTASPNIPSKVCYPNGQCVDLELELDMKATIETVGANGTITILADKLRKLGMELYAQNEITSEEVGIFNDIANQGYRIAEINGLIEDMAKACGTDAECFNSQKTTFDGGQKSMQELAGLIGYNPLSDDPADTKSNPEVETLWRAFESLPPRVWNSPELNNTVTTLTKQIGQTSNLVMWGTSNIQNGYLGPEGLHTYIVQEATGSIPKSGLAHGDSAKNSTVRDATEICTVGNGKSNGEACH